MRPISYSSIHVPGFSGYFIAIKLRFLEVFFNKDVLHPSVLAFRLSLYRHPSIYILFNSFFNSYNKQSNPWGRGFD
jgi:hypothetical protein